LRLLRLDRIDEWILTTPSTPPIIKVMLWKFYFFGMGFVVLFSGYYQVVTGSYSLFDLVNLASSVGLLVGAYAYVFKKKLLTSKNWGYIFKALVGLVVVNMVYQVWPSNYVGDFSLLNGALLTNIFAYLFVTAFYLPLYYAVYQLSLSKTPKKKR
jgi:hypothetical protein